MPEPMTEPPEPDPEPIRPLAPEPLTPERHLDEAQLALEVGTSPDRIRDLVAIGGLKPSALGRFVEADIPRARSMLAFVDAGLGFEQLGHLIADRHATFDFVDQFFMPLAPLSGRTFAEFVASLGEAGEIAAGAYAAMGLPEPDPASPTRVDEEAIVSELVATWRSIGGPEADAAQLVNRAARLMGESVRRAIEGWLQLYEGVTTRDRDRPILEPAEVRMAAVIDTSRRLADLAPRLLVWLEQRHLEQAMFAMNVEGMERHLPRLGYPPLRALRPPAIAFVDLTGFTAATELHGDHRAADLAVRLGELAASVANRWHGRLVKLLGDGAMLRFEDAEAAVPATLTLVEACAAADLPAAHAGIDAGPVIARDGDVFGRTVNLAARIGAAAGAGEVLVSGAVVADWTDPGFVFEPAGELDLKGVAAKVAVHRARRSGTG